MTPIFFTVHSISAIAADFLVASIWQGLVVAACVALLLRWLPGLTAAVRSTIWTAVLLLVLFFPGLSLTLHGGRAPSAAHGGLLHATDAWSLALLSVWAVFSLLRISQLVGSAVRLQQLARRADPVTPPESVAAILRGSSRRVTLCSSAEVDRPSVAGFLHPRILLSPELLAGLSAPELEQVVLHEVEHLRRYDDWTNLLQKLSLALIPLHPVLLWLDRQMCLERELACDDSVLRHTHARKAYAACLTRLAEGSIVRRGFSLALGALGARERTSELSGRVHRILRAPEKRMSRGKIWATTAAVLAAVFAGAAGLARSPQLVSFTPAAQPFAEARVQAAPHLEPGLESASFHPAISLRASAAWRPAAPQLSAAHETLLKATMPESRPAMPEHGPLAAVPAPATSGTTLRRVRVARTTLRRDLTTPTSYVAVSAWQPLMLPRQLPLTFPQYPQFLYAAVPVQNGWLIIQL